MLCWYYKIKITNAINENNDLSIAALKHIYHCDTCLKFYKLQKSIDMRLSYQNQKPQEHSGFSNILVNDVIRTIEPDKHNKTHRLPIPLSKRLMNKRTIIAAAAIWLLAIIPTVLHFVSNNDTERINQNDFSKGVSICKETFNEYLFGLDITSAGDLQAKLDELLASTWNNETQLIQQDTNRALKYLFSSLPIETNWKSPRQNSDS